MFTSIKLGIAAALLVAGWFVYGWGIEVINHYNALQIQNTTLKRDKALIESRVASYQTLLARRDAAIAASQCKAQIQYYIKNPERIPNLKDAFRTNEGG